MEERQVEQFETTQRTDAFRARMVRRGLSACILTLPENIYYLSGYDVPPTRNARALVVPAEGDPILVLPRRETVSGPLSARVLSYGHAADFAARLGAALAQMEATAETRVGFEASRHFLSVRQYRDLLRALPATVWIDISGMNEELRLTKTSLELVCVRNAGTAAALGMAMAMREVGAGHSENDVAAGIFTGMLRAGGEYPGSPPYVRSGARTVLPFATWEGARLEPGDVVLVEHAASFSRYHAALMRTACVGEPSGEQAAAYQAVRRGLEQMIATIRPGVPALEVDAVCRRELAASGFERGDLTGYSIGLAYPPGWNEAYMYGLTPRNDQAVREGMVMYLLPSVEVDSKFTVGCGDTVIVNQDGCDVVTRYPRELHVGLPRAETVSVGKATGGVGPPGGSP